MYKCYSCGTSFSEPKTEYDLVPYGSGYVKHASAEGCPYCGGDFGEAKICELCGDAFFEEDSKHDDVCQSCVNIDLNRYFELMEANFTLPQLKRLNVELDGRNIYR